MFDLHLLTPDQTLAYARFTAQRYRPWLTSGHDDVVAVGATWRGRPVGLALGTHTPGTAQATVRTVSVLPTYRRRGIGTALLQRLEATLSTRGAAQVEGEYPDNAAQPAVEALLARAGWGDRRLGRLIAVSELPVGIRAPWVHYPLPEGFEVFPWHARTAHDEERLRTWWPEQLAQSDPALHEERLAPDYGGRPALRLNSLGLRYDGEVVGWLLTHRTAPRALLHDRLFVAHALRHTGVGALLVGAAIRAHYAAEGACTPPHRFLCQTLGTNRPMLAFIRRRIRPYATSLTEVYTTSKALAAPAGMRCLPATPTLARTG